MGITLAGETRHFKVQSTTDGRTWDVIESVHFQTGGVSHRKQIVYWLETTDGHILKEIPGSIGEYTIPVLHDLIVVEITSNES